MGWIPVDHCGIVLLVVYFEKRFCPEASELTTIFCCLAGCIFSFQRLIRARLCPLTQTFSKYQKFYTAVFS